jgi:hypothetical protein
VPNFLIVSGSGYRAAQRGIARTIDAQILAVEIQRTVDEQERAAGGA